MSELKKHWIFNDANLVAYYQLEDINDNKASFHLTNNNSVGFSAAKFQNGADFGASNTNKSLSIASDLGITGGAITIVGWVKLLADIPDAGLWYFAALEDSTNDIQNSLAYSRSGSTRTLEFRRYRQGVSADSVNYNFDLGVGNWHHLAISYDATNLRGFLNGVLVAGPTAFSGNGSGVTAASFAIGNQRGLATGHNFYSSAIIDEVAVFNRGLTAEEIKSIYNAHIPLRTLRPAPFKPGIAR